MRVARAIGKGDSKGAFEGAMGSAASLALASMAMRRPVGISSLSRYQNSWSNSRMAERDFDRFKICGQINQAGNIPIEQTSVGLAEVVLLSHERDLSGVNPFVLGADLVGEGLLELVGKDAPGVGFDFEVGAGFGVFLEIGEGGFGVIKSGGKGGEGLGVKGDVEVNAPFGRGGVAIKFGEVSEAGEGGGIQDDLVKVSRFVELADGLEGFGVLRVEGEGVGEVDF